MIREEKGISGGFIYKRSQILHKRISTQGLTVLTTSVIVQIEQRKREMILKSFVGTQHFGFSKSA
ncbi:hypothetical protein B5F53_05985 [Blautia sp. An249]|uniref:hypothetical protein n=1 Tax=Blautia sp. An249 TaxID=1965603 RepID=UPI000B36B641|nr:hypothetical protein [Blautia sp. An249]OUO80004.1 hypothetical protein B5F53_05985 [Blautia sp. An249]